MIAFYRQMDCIWFGRNCHFAMRLATGGRFQPLLDYAYLFLCVLVGRLFLRLARMGGSDDKCHRVLYLTVQLHGGYFRCVVGRSRKLRAIMPPPHSESNAPS